jgi:hypothetical protein
MTLLRSAIVLFVSVTLVAAAIRWAALLAIGYLEFSWPPSSDEALMPILLIACVTLPVCVSLGILAWRGRRQPLSDGIAIVTVVMLAAAMFFFIRDTLVPSRFPDSAPIYTYIAFCFHLPFLIAAYTISYLALRRTPLLRGLTQDTRRSV